MPRDKIHHVREPAQSIGSTRPLALDPDRLFDLLDRPIAFHRVFVTLTGSVTAGLLLSQGLYWTRVKRRDDPASDGWFWKTQEEWEAETGMGRSEQETARRRLRHTGFWQEERRGVPAKLWFRIDLTRLAEALLREPQTPGKTRGNPQHNHQDAEIQHPSLQDSRTQACEDLADKPAGLPQPFITETTAETTLPETLPEIEHNVENVGSDRTKSKKPPPLTDREECLAQEIARHLDGDGHSLRAIRRIVSEAQGLGEAIAYRLFDETMEQEAARKIKTTPGRYFIDLAKREAGRQGIDLGFKRDKA